MKFWDSSAIVGLIVAEKESARLQALAREDPEIVAWWATPIECASAISRREREGLLETNAASAAFGRLTRLRAVWQEVQPVEQVRELSMRLLRVHNLRSSDSLQLAAALLASEQRPSSLDLVCLDGRLALAAQREGFNVIA